MPAAAATPAPADAEAADTGAADGGSSHGEAAMSNDGNAGLGIPVFLYWVVVLG